MNRLSGEKSPYLLQHADNPVDWYPWGEEAFAKARSEGKPLFLSIGYATCHWCHVMEHESFEDVETARVLNSSFVAVKVDREERPDVDRLYMAAANGAGWGGGWPLNLFLTPDLKPFYGGTYFPPEARWGRPSFVEVLGHVARTWSEQRAEVEADAGRLAEAVAAHAAESGERAKPEAGWPAALTASLAQGYDEAHGGFGSAPKFPMPVNLRFLLDEAGRTGDKRALELAAGALRAMGRGGVYDQVGGGFYRYSVDEAWRVPHFEKMLYDNAQLIVVLLQAYQGTRDAEFSRLARETLDYCLRDLARPEGGFYSAEDADSVPYGAPASSRPSEGAFYLWKASEVVQALGPDAALFSYRFGVEDAGNAPEDPHGEFSGANILHGAHSVEEAAARFKLTRAQARRTLEAARKTLLERRGARPRPLRDEKVLTSWNGLMLSALAKAASVLEDPRALASAEKTARFLRQSLFDAKTGRLKHRWASGEAAVDGLAEDYAFLAQGLIDLYEASFDPAWLEWALELTAGLEARHSDGKGGYFQSPSDGGKDLLARFSDDHDNVEPSAASVAAMNLLRLSQLAERPDLYKKALTVLERHGGVLRDSPRALPMMMAAVGRSLEKPRQVVVAGALSDPAAREMLRLVHARLRPPLSLLAVEPGPMRERLVKLNPLVRGMGPVKGKPTAYVCVNFSCELPTSDLETVRRLLDGDKEAR
ncbi:MAG: thioredoxin domain-containing protein [Elusimicrobia bacterium]|nr:thioredoxin domain-containing protein [Elusimicrobiota bacterium]